MMWSPNQSDDCAIVKYEGCPRGTESESERTRWERFKRFLWPFARQGGEWAKYGSELGCAYGEAKVANEQNQAEKTAREAAEIQARAEEKRVDTAIKVNKEIDEIFSKPDESTDAKLLKLASLLDAYPQLEAQLERVSRLLGELQLKRGLSIEMIESEPARLPAGQEAPAIEVTGETGQAQGTQEPELEEES